MIVQLKTKREEKDLRENLEFIWEQINGLRVCLYYLRENEHIVSDARDSIKVHPMDKRFKDLTSNIDDLEELVDCACFEDIEKATVRVLTDIDEDFFDGALFKKFIEESDDE